MKTADRRPGFTYLELTTVLLILGVLMGLAVPMVSNLVNGSQTAAAQTTVTQASLKALRDAILAYQKDMKGIAVWTSTTPGTAGAAPGTTGMPLTLKDLLVQPYSPSGNLVPAYNPATRLGWRGPYLQQATGAFTANLDGSFYPSGYAPGSAYNYGSLGDPAFVDGWLNPIVLQWPQPQLATDTVDVLVPYVRLVSAGAPTKNVNGTLYSVIDTLTNNPLLNSPTYSAAVRLTPSFPTPNQPLLPNQRGNDLVLFILTQDLYP